MEDTNSVTYGRAHVTGAGLETSGEEEIATILRNCQNPVWSMCQSQIVRDPTKGHSHPFTSLSLDLYQVLTKRTKAGVGTWEGTDGCGGQVQNTRHFTLKPKL